MSPSSRFQKHGTIFEFIVQGRYIKVSAIDTRTGREVSIVGDKRLSRRILEYQALQKLTYVLRKETQNYS